MKKITPRKIFKLAQAANKQVERANEKVRKLYWNTILLYKQTLDKERKLNEAKM